MKSERRWTVLIILLSIALIVVLGAGVIKEKKLNKKNAEEYSEWNKEKNNSPKVEEDVTEELPEAEEVVKKEDEILDFYGKLKNKQDVKILILGDGLALSEGKTSDAGVWDKNLALSIESTYGVKVELQSLSERGANVARGVQVLNNNPTVKDFDLVITCFGQIDKVGVNLDQFKNDYMKIINDLQTRNEKCVVMPILPSTINTESPYRIKIQEVATEKGLDVIDARGAFNNAGVPFESLLNGSLPNDKGYEVYTKEASKIIDAKVKQ